MAAQAQRAAAAAIAINNSTAARNRGRPTNIAKTTPIINNTIRANQQSVRPQITGGISLPNNFQYLQVISNIDKHILFFFCLSCSLFAFQYDKYLI